MRISLLFSALLLVTAVHAQKPADPKPFASGITEDALKKHLYIIAGKDFEGRETTTEGQRKAAAYIENHFRSLGLKPGNNGNYQMEYPVYQDSLLDAAVEINQQAFQLHTDFEPAINSNYSATLMGSEIVFAGYGISDSLQDDYKNLDVRGKIVLLLNGLPKDRAQKPRDWKTYNPYSKQDAAQQHGAVAVLIISADFPRKAGTGKGNMYTNGFKNTIRPNTFLISDKVAKAIVGNDYETLKTNPQGKSYNADILLRFNKNINVFHSTDVIGILEGTDLKDEYLVISAHYDHLGKRDSVIYYGADDDGSGTVSVLELASAFTKAKAAGKGPRRSIVFLANSGEEEGLWGSEFFTDHPTIPLDKTTADLNIDMVGRIDPNRNHGDSTNYVYVVGDDKLSSDLKPISEEMNRKYTKMELDYKFNDPKDPEHIYYRSDHYNFARKGVPIIFYFDGIHKDYHRPTDTPDKINYDILRKRDQLVFYTAWAMANRDNMLKRDIPLQ